MEKNITIEDKAKAYDEAVKEASIAYKDEDRHLKAVLERIFPELADSKDERIRKAIIKFLIDVNNGAYRKSELEIASWIAWLEKQGQNKLIDKVEPKFKVGDTVRFKGNETLKGEAETHKIVGYDNELYVFADGTTDLFCEQELYELVEQKSIAWSEEDDALLYGVIETEQYMLDVVTGLKTFDVGNEQIESQCAKELEWLKTLKERIQPQNTWKPSEHELEVLKLVAEKDGTCLMGLYKQLKKLKEE